MDFQYQARRVPDEEIQRLVKFVTELQPTEAEQADVEQVLFMVGLLIAGAYGVPPEVILWIRALAPGLLLLTRTCMKGVMANAGYMMHRQVEKAVYGLTAYEWLYHPNPNAPLGAPFMCEAPKPSETPSKG